MSVERKVTPINWVNLRRKIVWKDFSLPGERFLEHVLGLLLSWPIQIIQIWSHQGRRGKHDLISKRIYSNKVQFSFESVQYCYLNSYTPAVSRQGLRAEHDYIYSRRSLSTVNYPYKVADFSSLFWFMLWHLKPCSLLNAWGECANNRSLIKKIVKVSTH